MLDIQTLDKLRTELLNIDEIKDYTKGNIYVTYLDEWSIFPCITLYPIATRTDEGLKSISLQVKTWTLNKDSENELFRIYDILFEFFDKRKKDEWKVIELFYGSQGESENNRLKFILESEKEDSEVQVIAGKVGDKILKEKINDIDVYSLPLILSAKGIEDIEPEYDKPVEDSEVQVMVAET